MKFALKGDGRVIVMHLLFAVFCGQVIPLGFAPMATKLAQGPGWRKLRAPLLMAPIVREKQLDTHQPRFPTLTTHPTAEVASQRSHDSIEPHTTNQLHQH